MSDKDLVRSTIVSTPFWSYEELKLLLMGKDVPGRSKESIAIKRITLRKNGIKITASRLKWTNEEISKLECAEATISRSKGAIKYKKRQLKLGIKPAKEVTVKYWSDEEITALLNGEVIPGRSAAICRAKLVQLELEGYDVQGLASRYRNKWTDDEVNLLRKGNAIDGRSRSSVNSMRSKLGFTNNVYYKEDELRVIQDYYPEEYLDVSLRLDRSICSIKHIVRNMIERSEQFYDGKTIRDFIVLHDQYGPDAWRYTGTKDYFLCMNLAKQLDLNMNKWTFKEDNAIALYGTNIQLKNRTQSQIEFRSKHLGENTVGRHLTNMEKELILREFQFKGFRLLYDIPRLRYYEIEKFACNHNLKRPQLTEADRAEAISLAAARRGDISV